uniref:Putative LAGLIDADG homing endonuclease n=1 Tax=Stigeoclonium helveticum TaxID=55999 RepID=A0A6M4SP22_STIHE|nr:putative LAGLIDADG homing endonuclease [Stigeoclonium helveticum]
MVLTKQSLQLPKIKYAYIAGFLDGDGCINAQIVKKSDYKLKFQIRVTVTFYQKTSRKYFLLELHKLLNLGVIRHKKNGMSDYTITGFNNVLIILKEIYPFLVLKKKASLVYL